MELKPNRHLEDPPPYSPPHSPLSPWSELRTPSEHSTVIITPQHCPYTTTITTGPTLASPEVVMPPQQASNHASEIQVTAQALKLVPTTAYCSNCNGLIVTRVERSFKAKAHMAAGVFCLFL